VLFQLSITAGYLGCLYRPGSIYW